MKSHVKEWTHGDWRTEFEGPHKGEPKNIPPGEWDNEPDKIQWLDEETRLDCLMVRNHFGNWCGYVGVPEGHPLFGLRYDGVSEKLVALRDAMLQKPVPENPSFAVCISMLSGELEPRPDTVLDVHGGITFSDFCHDGQPEGKGICHVPIEGRPARVWWFGFDCAHSGDLSPGLHSFLADFGFGTHRSDVYRNREYVEEEVTKLARQLKDLELAAAP